MGMGQSLLSVNPRAVVCGDLRGMLLAPLHRGDLSSGVEIRPSAGVSTCWGTGIETIYDVQAASSGILHLLNTVLL